MGRPAGRYATGIPRGGTPAMASGTVGSIPEHATFADRGSGYLPLGGGARWSVGRWVSGSVSRRTHGPRH